jgi:DnaJ-class molecular chaperone
MDYYSTLGLNRGASADDIKKAYRSLAMKHHPDRGGDEKKFKEISQAYEFLTDPEKKQMIDQGMDPNNMNAGGFGQGHPFEFHFNTNNLDEIFGRFGFGMGGFPGRQQRRNRSVNINVEIDLEEVLTGRNLDADISIPGGRRKAINISIPPGIDHGQQVRYRGMGDNSFSDVPAGDLLVNIFVRPHDVFERNGDSIICEKSVSIWDALLGTEISVTGLDRKEFKVSIPPGTQPGTVLSCKGEGLPRLNSHLRGDLLIKIRIEIPRLLSPAQKHLIEQIKKNGF